MEARSQPAAEAANLQPRICDEIGVRPDERKHSSRKDLSRAERWAANCRSGQIRRDSQRALPCPSHGNSSAAKSDRQVPDSECGANADRAAVWGSVADAA